MTDLINRSVNEVNYYINEYDEILRLCRFDEVKDVQVFSIILHIGINHLKNNYIDLSSDCKSWAMTAIRDIYHELGIKYEEEVNKYIDEYILFWKNKYDAYVEDTIANSEYSRDYGFVRKFVFNKKRQ